SSEPASIPIRPMRTPSSTLSSRWAIWLTVGKPSIPASPFSECAPRKIRFTRSGSDGARSSATRSAATPSRISRASPWNSPRSSGISGLQHVAHRLPEHFDVEGLHEVLRRAELHRPLEVALGGVGRDHEHRDLLEALVIA